MTPQQIPSPQRPPLPMLVMPRAICSALQWQSCACFLLGAVSFALKCEGAGQFLSLGPEREGGVQETRLGTTSFS